MRLDGLLLGVITRLAHIAPRLCWAYLRREFCGRQIWLGLIEILTQFPFHQSLQLTEQVAIFRRAPALRGKLASSM
jgi:hypothetical protein